MFEMLCLDVDGTLLDSRLKIPLENKKMIEALKRSGVPIVLTSARPPVGMMPLVLELGIEHCPLIAFGGGYISLEGKEILRKVIPIIHALKILEIVKKHGCGHITVYNGDHWAVHEFDEITSFEIDLLGIEPEYVGDLEQVLTESFTEGVDKFLIGGDHEHLKDLKKKLDELEFEIESVFSKPQYLEIFSKGISKAAAVCKIAEILGIERSKVIACGDNFNDLPMINWAGIGVAMGNAPKEVRRRADYITLTNDEGGVAHVIQRFFEADDIIGNAEEALP